MFNRVNKVFGKILALAMALAIFQATEPTLTENITLTAATAIIMVLIRASALF